MLKATERKHKQSVNTKPYQLRVG